MIDRQKIVNGLSEGLQKNKFVLAMWLEGADANGLKLISEKRKILIR